MQPLEPTTTPDRAARISTIRVLKRLLLTTALLSALFALMPATASAAECWKELVNDYWADNRVDGQYPIDCYRQAMSELPRDVQEYSDAQDDLRRALLFAVRQKRLNEGYEPEFDEGDDGVATAAPPPDDEGGDGFFIEVLKKLGPDNADSVPVPLLVLAAIALLLIGAAGVSYVTRWLQARRMDAPKPAP
jgi:hypothetical protein